MKLLPRRIGMRSPGAVPWRIEVEVCSVLLRLFADWVVDNDRLLLGPALRNGLWPGLIRLGIH